MLLIAESRARRTADRPARSFVSFRWVCASSLTSCASCGCSAVQRRPAAWYPASRGAGNGNVRAVVGRCGQRGGRARDPCARAAGATVRGSARAIALGARHAGLADLEALADDPLLSAASAPSTRRAAARSRAAGAAGACAAAAHSAALARGSAHARARLEPAATVSRGSDAPPSAAVAPPSPRVAGSPSRPASSSSAGRRGRGRDRPPRHHRVHRRAWRRFWLDTGLSGASSPAPLLASSLMSTTPAATGTKAEGDATHRGRACSAASRRSLALLNLASLLLPPRAISVRISARHVRLSARHRRWPARSGPGQAAARAAVVQRHDVCASCSWYEPRSCASSSRMGARRLS